MTNRFVLICALMLAGLYLALAPVWTCKSDINDPKHETDHEAETVMSWDSVYLAARIFLGKLPDKMPGSESDTPEKIALGKRLYFEKGMSTNKRQSCNDCHFLDEGRAGVDYRPVSFGASCAFGKRNSPTVINAGFQRHQFWDGRAADLVEQAKGPILNPVEMAMKSPEEVVQSLQSSEGYSEAFQAAFPGESEAISYHNLAIAIAAFERTLISRSRFDLLIAGDQTALSEPEKRGLTKFITLDCSECHSGPTVGGQIFRKIGLRNAYDTPDTGRFEITKKEEDRFVFKVPMLRNVTLTPPYFHDGKITELREAVRLMGHHQLDHKLSPEDIDIIIVFLHTLQGELPKI